MKNLEEMINRMTGACIETYGFTKGRNVAETICGPIMDDILKKAEGTPLGEECSETYLTEDRKLRFDVTVVMTQIDDEFFCFPKRLLINGKEV